MRAAEIIKSLLEKREKTEKALIVLSAPHAFASKKSQGHMHDSLAPIVAEGVRRRLREKGIEATAYLGNRARAEIDFNRKDSRESEWRQGLTDLMKGSDLLVDIHSYSDEDSDFSEYEAVIYTNWVKPEILQHFSNALGDLHLMNFECRDAEDPDGIPHSHDIVEEAAERGVDAILIEFNEGLDGGRLSTVMDSLADGIAGWIGGTNEN